MYIPTGISCAGKSTLGRAIAEIKGIEMIELNEIQKELGFGLQGEHIPEEQYGVFHQEAQRRARQRLQEGKSIVYDTTPFTRAKREELRQLATECSADTVLIYVQASITLALQWWEAEKNNPDRHIDVHINNFMYVADHFEPPVDEDHIVFEAGDNIPEWINNHL